jgi:hypothetical protein
MMSVAEPGPISILSPDSDEPPKEHETNAAVKLKRTWFYRSLHAELPLLYRVVCGEEPIPSGARLQDGLQMMGWIDQLVQVSQNN